MRKVLSPLLFGSLFLVFAASAFGQNSVPRVPAAMSPPMSSGSGAGDTSTPAVIGFDFYRPTNNVYCTSDPACASHLPEQFEPDAIVPADASPSATSTITYAHGDASFVPSQYMDYEQALALGKKVLQQQANPQAQLSLAEVAHSLRGNSNTATLRPGRLSAIQNGNGQLIICRNGDSRCNVSY